MGLKFWRKIVPLPFQTRLLFPRLPVKSKFFFCFFSPTVVFIVFIFQVAGLRNGLQFAFDKSGGGYFYNRKFWKVEPGLTAAGQECVFAEWPFKETIKCIYREESEKWWLHFYIVYCILKEILLPLHSNATHEHEPIQTYQRFCQRGQRVRVWTQSLDDVSAPRLTAGCDKSLWACSGMCLCVCSSERQVVEELNHFAPPCFRVASSSGKTMQE